jgi:dienelactone hydrolase
MHRTLLLLSLSALLVGCSSTPSGPRPSITGGEGEPGELNASPLVKARVGFQTRLVAGRPEEREPVAPPPLEAFRQVEYESKVGKLPAYLTSDPTGGKKKYPAIIWIHGGDCNSIGDVWSPGRASNDQTAAAYRHAGIVMLFPSLRGGNQNPSLREGFLGEVDDILAARDFLVKHKYVQKTDKPEEDKPEEAEKKRYIDPDRIYLGGHSTGGTLVFLVAASTDKFRAVFSFGPVADVKNGYKDEVGVLPFDLTNDRETELRSPVRWTHSVRCPLFVFEGDQKPGQITSLTELTQKSKNPLIHCYPVPDKDHFSVLAPLNRMLAQKILHDEGPKTNITITDADLR